MMMMIIIIMIMILWRCFTATTRQNVTCGASVPCAQRVVHDVPSPVCAVWRISVVIRGGTPKPEVIAYTLLVGSFPFSGRDGDNAMLQRIAAGRWVPGCPWLIIGSTQRHRGSKQMGRFATERDAWKNASPSAKDSS